MQYKFKFAGLIASVLIISNSFSQVSNVNNVQPELKKNSFNHDFTNVVIRFHKLFSNAEHVSWYKVHRNYGATFVANDLRYRVLLHRNGDLVYKITYGKEKHLPVHIRKMVKGSYVEFQITASCLLEKENREIWVIYLEDDRRHVTVSVENNELSEVSNIERKN
jgi:hypothetical protein